MCVAYDIRCWCGKIIVMTQLEKKKRYKSYFVTAIGVLALVGIVYISISQKNLKLDEFRLINIFLLGFFPKNFSKMQLLDLELYFASLGFWTIF